MVLPTLRAVGSRPAGGTPVFDEVNVLPSHYQCDAFVFLITLFKEHLGTLKLLASDVFLLMDNLRSLAFRISRGLPCRADDRPPPSTTVNNCLFLVVNFSVERLMDRRRALAETLTSTCTA